MSKPVMLALSAEEALVLFEWVARFNARPSTDFEDQAEQRILWNLEAMLESSLVEPFAEDYRARLLAARSKVRDGSG